MIQDLRGHFKSEGQAAIIFGNDGLGEHQDGPDTLAWVARHPWDNRDNRDVFDNLSFASYLW